MSKAAKKNIYLAIAMLVTFAFRLIPPSGALTAEGLAVLGIFFGSLIMWITISIDWPSLITIFLIGFLPSFGFGKTFQGAFGNSTVAFLIFTFMLVYPLGKTNFVRRCTIAFITNRIARKGPWYFTCFLIASVTFMGLFISPSVLFVAFLPFLLDILDVLGIEKGGKTGKMLMMGCAFAISLSSGMTMIGHVWPTLAVGFYKGATGVDISQFQYMAWGIPTGLILLILMLLVFRFIFRPDDIKKVNPENCLALRGTVPPADRKEKIVLLAMILTVCLWVLPSLFKNVLPDVYKTINSWTTAMPPMVGCLVLFICLDKGERIMNFAEATSKGVMWASILMTAAATMLGSCLTSDATGISTWLSETLSPVTAGLPVMALIVFFVAWAILETNFSSNIVTTNVVCSVALAVFLTLPAGTVSMAAGLSIIGMCAAICNMTPAGQSTINTVAIGSGWATSKDMFVWGGVFAILGVIVVSFIGYPLASLFMAGMA